MQTNKESMTRSRGGAKVLRLQTWLFDLQTRDIKVLSLIPRGRKNVGFAAPKCALKIEAIVARVFLEGHGMLIRVVHCAGGEFQARCLLVDVQPFL